MVSPRVLFPPWVLGFLSGFLWCGVDLGMAREKGEAFVRWLSANSCNHARVVPTHLGADRGWCAFADSTCVRWWHGRK